jgi:hypothetical protein
VIRPEDDLFHVPGDDPYYNESSFNSFNIPSLKVNGFVYFFHRPNMNLSAGGVGLWGPPGGEDTYNCLHYEYDQLLQLPPGAEMFDFSLDNNLTVECLELQKNHRFTYKGDGCELDLVSQVFMDPHDPMEAERAKGGLGWGEWAVHHYSQGARVTGTVKIGGETLAVDSLGIRDHSWGRRRRTGFWPRGSYSFGFNSESSSFEYHAVSKLPEEADPVFGTTEEIQHGWYMKDGVLGDLVLGTRKVERAKDGRPTRVVVEATDNLGRTLHAVARCESYLKWFGDVIPDCFTWWTLASWEFDGQQGWGEEEDYFTVGQWRRFARTLK